MQVCSDLAHVVLVLVVVTVVIVHIGLEGVLVVIHFCVAILFVNCCIRRCSLYIPRFGVVRCMRHLLGEGAQNVGPLTLSCVRDVV